MRNFYGKYFDKDADDKYNLKAIAKKLRAVIAKGKKEGLIDKGFRTYVRVDGNVITINVKAFPKGVGMYSEAYLNGEFLTRKGTDEEVFTKEWFKAKEFLKEVIDYWNYDRSEPETDYYDTNYYSRVEVDYDLRADYDAEARRLIEA